MKLHLCCPDDDTSEEENASDDNMSDSENEQPRVPKKKLKTYDVSQPSGPTTTLSSSCSASKSFELIFSVLLTRLLLKLIFMPKPTFITRI